jgi:hypothetical protein
MMVFVSYARSDRESVDSLVHDLQRAKHTVWLDDELTGGQAWWDAILDRIRTCELFVFALSPDSLRSRACQAELTYAVTLDRPVLPVMVRTVPVQIVPPVLSNAQITDYTSRTADSAVSLITAAAATPASPPLPTPLPAPPPTPLSYMNSYREQLQAAELSYQDQTQLVAALRRHMNDEDERAVARDLLTEFRSRPDIAESVARDVDVALAEPIDRGDASSSATESPAGGWHPDPTGRFEQRYWDGESWTEHVARGGTRSTDPVQTRAGPRQGSTAAAGNSESASSGEPAGTAQVRSAGPQVGAAFTTGAFIALIIATVFIPLVGIIVGAINLKHPPRRNQALALLWIGIGVIVLFVIGTASGG